MKTTFLTTVLLLFFASPVLAHKEELEITNPAEADWLGPAIAVLIVVGTIIVARIIRAKSSKQIINNNQK